MRRACLAVLAGLAAALALAGPASGHGGEEGADWLLDAADPPGWFTPSPTSSSGDLRLAGSVPRGRYANNYRNSDLAFWGRLAFAGHYDGFQIVDVANPRRPQQIVDFICPGSQHDVSVWQNLLFVSVESPRSGPGCDSTPQAPGFEGMRIFDVSNPRAPSLITGVPTDCGSHTHTLVPDVENGRVLLYVSSYTASVLAESAYGNECVRFDESGERAHKKISVVEVPLDEPAAASVVSEPRIPQNDYRNIPGFNGCHDITVFTGLDRAAAACMGEGQIWDISDKEQPEVLARIHNPNVEFFHSATFTWDGSTVAFGDEAGGGTQPRCREQDPATLGAIWFYDTGGLDNLDGSTVEPWEGSFKQPRVQGDAANCTMHNFNVLPTRRSDVLVSSAYAAGTTVVDFTNPSRPREIAHLDQEGSNTWSSYWYDGSIVTNDSGRGLDVMELRDRRARATRPQRYSNPQTQEDVLR